MHKVKHSNDSWSVININIEDDSVGFENKLSELGLLLSRCAGANEPQDLTEAVVRGASERLAPILMTALSAALALVPIALRMGEAGNEIQAPMAIAILFGLLSSTTLNMVVVTRFMSSNDEGHDREPVASCLSTPGSVRPTGAEKTMAS